MKNLILWLSGYFTFNNYFTFNQVTVNNYLTLNCDLSGLTHEQVIKSMWNSAMRI